MRQCIQCFKMLFFTFSFLTILISCGRAGNVNNNIINDERPNGPKENFKFVLFAARWRSALTDNNNQVKASHVVNEILDKGMNDPEFREKFFCYDMSQNDINALPISDVGLDGLNDFLRDKLLVNILSEENNIIIISSRLEFEIDGHGIVESGRFSVGYVCPDNEVKKANNLICQTAQITRITR